MTRNQIRVGFAALAGCALLLTAAPAMAQNGTQAFKCAGAISKVSTKIASFVEKFVTKCTNDYVKRNLFLVGEKGKDASALDKSGELCQKFVNDKALAAVTANDVDAAACGDDDLAALGHIPTAATGGEAVYAGLVKLDALRSGLRAAANTAPDLWAIMDAVEDVGTPCTACATLRNALYGRGIGPCASVVANIGAGTAVTVNGDGGFTAATTVSGNAALDVCRWEDALSGAFGVFGGPSRSLSALVGGFIPVCVDVPINKGFVNDLTGGKTVSSLEICQDHDVDDGSDECQVTGVNGSPFAASDCQPSQPEGHCNPAPGIGTDFCTSDAQCPTGSVCDFTGSTLVAGSACSRFAAPTSTGAGEGMIASTLINTVILGTSGPDGIPCTDDDTADPGTPVATVQTTQDATIVVYDVNRAGGTLAPATLSGTAVPTSAPDVGPFENGTFENGLGGGGAAFVSGFPALNVDLSPLYRGDIVTTIRLEYE